MPENKNKIEGAINTKLIQIYTGKGNDNKAKEAKQLKIK